MEDATKTFELEASGRGEMGWLCVVRACRRVSGSAWSVWRDGLLNSCIRADSVQLGLSSRAAVKCRPSIHANSMAHRELDAWLCMTVCMRSVRRGLSCIDCRKYLLQEERVLIICGKATLTPDDGSAAVTISAGDFIRFHKGSRPYANFSISFVFVTFVCPDGWKIHLHEMWLHSYCQRTDTHRLCLRMARAGAHEEALLLL